MIALRPDYKPGDDEFDFDATAVRDGHDFVYNVDHLQAAFNRLKRNYYAACRQAEYWRHEAVTAGCATDTDAARLPEAETSTMYKMS